MQKLYPIGLLHKCVESQRRPPFGQRPMARGVKGKLHTVAVQPMAGWVQEISRP